MTDQKISELNAITGANVSDANDKIAIVDASGSETKSITREELFKSVDGTTFHVDSTNNRVGVGTTSPSALLDVAGNAEINGNITVTGNVDGYDVSALGSKLAGIESGATADQTAAEIKTAYESNADTNAFTDAEQSKLSGIEANADVTDTANVTAAIGQGVGTSDSPSFAGLTVDTDTLHVDSTNNRVGIGTSSPGAALDIDTASFLKILVDDGNDVPFSLGASTTGFTIANNTGATTADESITFAQNDGSIRMGTAGSEAMRIASSGSVGIGTTGPSEKLDVNGGNITVSSSNNYPLRVNSTDPGSTVVFSDSGSANAFHQGIGALGDDMRILAGNNVRVFVESSGNVGIGTTSPGAALDVDAGVVKLNGNTISSIQVTVADDAVAELTFTNREFGMLTVHEGADNDTFPYSAAYFLGYFDFGSSPATGTAVKGGSTDVVTTALTGTTGTDGKVTIGGTGGTLYIENRLGSAQVFNVTLM